MYAHQIENCSILKINGGEGLAKKERFVSLSTVVDKKKKEKEKCKKASHPEVHWTSTMVIAGKVGPRD